MKALLLTRYDGNEAVEIRDVPPPRPGPDDVLLEVHAASVNPIDWKTRDGTLKRLLPYALPHVLGSDASGVVREVGSQVTRFQPGDEVYTRVDKARIGTFAELVAVRQDEVAAKPRSLDHREAAALPLVALTAWQGLVERCALAAGDRVFIQGGSGGVGTAAIQIAKARGAATVATTVGARNVELVRRLGADVAIDYKAQRFDDELSDYDVAFDVFGGEQLRRTFSVLRPGGRLVTIQGIPDAATLRAYGHPLLAIVGWLANRKWRQLARQRGVAFHYLLMHASGAQLSELAALVDTGRLRPVIDRVFPLEEARAAFAYSESGHATGKVVIAVRP